jgi:hypothetical protein
VKFESICAISVSDFLRETLWQIDDLYCFEGASLNAHTATNTKSFRDETNGRSRINFDAYLSSFIYGTSLLAFLFALFRLALVGIDNSDSEFVVSYAAFHI